MQSPKALSVSFQYDHLIMWVIISCFVNTVIYEGTKATLCISIDMIDLRQNKYTLSVSVYYVAVRTIVLSRHGSNLARPVIIHDIIHGLIYVPSTPCCGFFGVSPDGNCAYVH